MIVFDLFLSNVKYCFVILYRPPKLSTDSLSDAEHFNRIITQLSHLNKPVFVVGDINCRNIDWSYCVKPSNNVEEIIFNTFCNNGYTQCVTCSTRGDSLLDIICTNEPVLLRNAYTTPPIAGSDHDSVVFIINVPDSAIHSHTNNTNTSCHKSVLWKQGDYESMRQFLADIKWSDILTVNFTPDDLWSAFCSILNDAIELYVPYKLCSNASQRSHCRRYCPKSVRTVRNKKLAAWRLYRKNKSNLNLRERYNKLCAQYKREIRNHEIERERTLLETNNLGDFYKYVNGKLSCPSGVGVLLDEHGQCVVDDCERAELLNNYFVSVCTTSANNVINPDLSYLRDISQNISDSIENIAFDEFKLISACKKIKTKCKTSVDPDGYPTILLIELMSVLCVPLSLIFNSFVSVGKLPTSWKSAVVIPLYKKGVSSDLRNYRPISKTSIFCKLLERVVVNDLTKYLVESNLLNSNQHGFRQRKSTVTNLLESLSYCISNLDKKLPTTTIFFDFKKAFDVVPHNILIQKLSAYGIKGNLLKLIIDFLTNRTQVTKIGSAQSNSAIIPSGVIQGSCLGPLLFLIYINDLPSKIRYPSKIKLFADDLKVFDSIISKLNESNLQYNISETANWSEVNGLPFSLEKCNLMHTRTLRDSSYSPPTYFLKNKIIQPNSTVRDLGVILNNHANFNDHINNIVRKASARSSLIFKCFLSRDLNNMLKAFTVYVRPLVEYCSPVWSPHCKKHILAIESVQRSFTKRLPGLQNLTYLQRLERLNLETLETRRLKADLILMYKIIFRHVDTELADSFEFSTYTSTRGHPYKLVIPKFKTDCYKYFFTCRLIHIWNDLNVNFSSLISFRNSLSKNNLSKYIVLSDKDFK